MRSIKRNWEHSIPIILAAALFIFEFFEHFGNFGHEVLKEAFPWLTLVFLVSISAQLIKLDRPLPDRVLAQLLTEYARDNSFVEDLAKSTVANLNDKLKSEGFTTTSEGQSSEELVRAVTLCKSGDSVSAISYRIPWTTSLHDYLEATLDAIRRGVSITRIFIIPPELLDAGNCDAAIKTWQAMKLQASNGIAVKYIEENDIPNTDYFRSHDMGMVEFRYGNNSVVMHETVPAAGSSDSRRPLLLTISWSPGIIADERKHFEKIIGLRAFLQDVEPNSKVLAPPWIKDRSAASQVASTSATPSTPASCTGIVQKAG